MVIIPPASSITILLLESGYQAHGLLPRWWEDFEFEPPGDEAAQRGFRGIRKKGVT
jgi:hypothetical protein